MIGAPTTIKRKSESSLTEKNSPVSQFDKAREHLSATDERAMRSTT